MSFGPLKSAAYPEEDMARRLLNGELKVVQVEHHVTTPYDQYHHYNKPTQSVMSGPIRHEYQVTLIEVMPSNPPTDQGYDYQKYERRVSKQKPTTAITKLREEISAVTRGSSE